MSGIFNAQRAAYCGLILAGVRPIQAMKIARTNKTTLKQYLDRDWFAPVARSRVRCDGHALPSIPMTERNRAIIEHFSGGHRTLQETANAFGITRERVRQILEIYGIQARTHGSTSREVKEAALAVYRGAINKWLGVPDAAARTGHPYSVLREWALELGQTLPKPRSARRERWPEIARFYQEHPTLKQNEVAKHFNVSQNEVSRALREIGVPSRWWTSPDVAAQRHAPRPRPPIRSIGTWRE